jgi:hypothetical protein
VEQDHRGDTAEDGDMQVHTHAGSVSAWRGR